MKYVPLPETDDEYLLRTSQPRNAATRCSKHWTYDFIGIVEFQTAIALLRSFHCPSPFAVSCINLATHPDHKPGRFRYLSSVSTRTA